MTSPLMRYQDGFWPNLLALIYGLSAYAGGIVMIISSSVMLNVGGVVLLAHGMVVCAYMIHECAHNTVFAKNAYNARLGGVLNWIAGGCYGRYEDLRHKHFRHHVDRADVVSFDYRDWLSRRPWLARLVARLEWAYVPAVELIMHAFVIELPFISEAYRETRARVVTVLLVRVALLALLAAWSAKALLLYMVAYFMFLTVLRFMDAFQHTYEVFVTLEQLPVTGTKTFDRDYEFRNTFSNPISMRFPWLNLLVLNFGFHNAHHARPTAPWYRLPALHRELYGADNSQVLPFRNLLASYHKNRVTRVMNADAGDVGIGVGAGENFVGVNGVSFLTAL